MTRKELEEIGIDDEAINKIMAINGKDVNKLKATIDELNEKIGINDEKLKSQKERIDELEKIDMEAIKKEQYELGLAEGSKAIDEFKKGNAIKSVFENEFDVDGIMYKVKDEKALKGYLDDEKIVYENDTITGLVEQLQEIAKTSPFLFDTNKPTPQFADTTTNNITKTPESENALRQAMGLEIKKD